MILNTYLKKNNIILEKHHKSWLGINIIRCFKSLYPNERINKVTISEKGMKMQVIDYPKEFLESDYVKKIIKKFTNKHNSNSTIN